jgi:hypothetical protein
MSSQLWRTSFTVTSRRLAFPLDMLRYDGCYPQTSSDVATIERTFDLQQRILLDGDFKVTLVMYGRGRREPEKDRWLSFGWSVDPRSIRQEKA